MAAVGFQQSQKSSMNFSLSLDRSVDGSDDLNQRIEEFKHQNPEDVEELKKCIQDVLGEAEKTAQEKIDKKAVSGRFVLTFSLRALNFFGLRAFRSQNKRKGNQRAAYNVVPRLPSISINLHSIEPNNFLPTERRSEGEEYDCFHVGTEGQKQASCDACQKPRTISNRHDL